MSYTTWTPEQCALLVEKFPVLTARELGALLGRGPAAVRMKAVALGLQKSPDWVAEMARRTTLARSPFTPEVVQTIERLYATTLTAKLAAMLGLRKEQIHAYASRNGLAKTPEFVRETARARSGPDHPMAKAWFRKGQEPANKGKKGISHPGSEATQFKPGTKPYTTKPIGSYRVMRPSKAKCDENVKPQLQRKVSDEPGPNDRRWHPVSRLVWEEAHGPVPDGHVVVFKKGRYSIKLEEITLDAVECISRQELARRNHWGHLPPELASLTMLRGALTRAINKRTREAAPSEGVSP